jgi:hypothetical protein
VESRETRNVCAKGNVRRGRVGNRVVSWKNADVKKKFKGGRLSNRNGENPSRRRLDGGGVIMEVEERREGGYSVRNLVDTYAGKILGSNSDHLTKNHTTHQMPSNAPQQVADFTTRCEQQNICQRCKEACEPGVQLQFMHPRNPTGSGKWLCIGCHQYYVRKSSARTEGVSLSSFFRANDIALA